MVLPSPSGNKQSANVSEPSQGQAAPETTGQGYVTREELAAFESGLKDTLGKWYQGIQSQTGSYQANVNKSLKALEETLGVLKTQGVELTPDQIEGAKTRVKLNALEGTPTEPAPPVQGQPEGAEGDLLATYQQTVTNAAIRMMQVAGVEIEDDDPEVAIIEASAEGSSDAFLDAVAKAIETKKVRLGQKPTAASLPALGGGGTPASNPIQNIIDPGELWNLAKQQGHIK